MYIMYVIVLMPLVANAGRLSVDDVFTNFEKRLSSEDVNEDEFETVDPTTQAKIDTQDLLSINRKQVTFPSKGILVTNSILPLSIPTTKYIDLSKSVQNLTDLAPRDTYVKSLVKKKLKVEKYYNSICNLQGDVQRQYSKRFIVTIFVASLTALFVSIPTSVGVVAALGAFEENNQNREEVEVGIENNEEKEDRDDFFNNKIESLRVDTKSLEARLNIQDQAHTLERNFDNLYSLLTTVINPESYDYESNFFLSQTLRSITSNKPFMRMLNGNKFGLDDQVTLLTLSESDSFIITDDDNHKCTKSYAVQKLMTVIPDDEYAAEATDDKYRYKINNQLSLWLNPDLVMTPSKYRPKHTFSKMRTIIGSNEKITRVLPYNNTVFFLHTEGGFDMTRTCGEHSSTFKVFPNPIFHLPLGCSLTSRYFNVSSFAIFYNNNEVQTTEEFNIDQELFHPVYDLERIHTEAYEMKEKIHKIFTNSQRISQIEMEKLERRETLDRIRDKVGSIITSVKNFCKDVQDEFFLEPLYKISGIVGGFLILALIILVLFKKGWNYRKNKTA